MIKYFLALSFSIVFEKCQRIRIKEIPGQPCQTTVSEFNKLQDSLFTKILDHTLYFDSIRVKPLNRNLENNSNNEIKKSSLLISYDGTVKYNADEGTWSKDGISIHFDFPSIACSKDAFIGHFTLKGRGNNKYVFIQNKIIDSARYKCEFTFIQR